VPREVGVTGTEASPSGDELRGRSALVTGGGRGIGRSIAIGLADAGVRVALLARSQSELEAVASEIADRGGRAEVIPADMGSPDAIADAATRALALFGSVDILINNAAVVWPIGPSTTVGIDEWASALAINVTGVVQLTSALLPGMLAKGWGRIVNVSSGVVAHPEFMVGANAYVTSKAALEGHTKSLAIELAETGVTVNAYRPGGVDTAMQAWIRSQPAEAIGEVLHNRFIASHEQGRLLTPDASAASLLRRIPTDATGMIWDVTDE
jgi:NAD(P)-dependent dehydrogenase (short-subunit alcohol dehydrogenase family)